jgi:tRNA nucleotidyltransferase (CCA-adding enzyme)
MVKQPSGPLTALESHPQWPLAIKIYQKLRDEGHETYLAGGCVRDLLLNTKPKDIDIATAAHPEEVLSFFPQTVEVGKAFGVVRVVEDGQVVEVATFREDGEYKDGRRPENVTYSDPESDAERRDFTINALFLDLEKKEIIDFVGGIADLHKQLIKTVGAPEKRFEEDHLRILRAVRFSAQLGFDIDQKTWKSVRDQSELLKTVSEERIRDEILKLLSSKQVLKGLVQLHQGNLLKVLSPELFKSSEDQFMDWMKLSSAIVKDSISTGLLWAFYFWPLIKTAKDWNQFLATADKYKLTKEEKKSLKVAFDFVRKGKDWLKSRLGEKILFYASQEGPTLLNMQSALDPMTWGKEVFSLRNETHRIAPDGKLPAALLNGDDVMHLEGKARGEKLLEAYILQLEGTLNTREEALNWLKSA